MTTPFRRIAVLATVALLALPGAVAAAHPGNAAHGKSHAGTTTPTADAPSSAAKHAYGKACQGQSRKHVKGQKGTPFSQCVNALAKLASGEAKSAKAACKTLSHKHVKGQKGTPFSQCIKAANKLGDDSSSTGDDSSSTGDDTGAGDGTPTGGDTPPATDDPATDTTPSA